VIPSDGAKLIAGDAVLQVVAMAEAKERANGTTLDTEALATLNIYSLAAYQLLNNYLSRSVSDQWYTTPRRRSICISDSQALVRSCRCFHLGTQNIYISPALTDVVDLVRARSWCPNIYLSETETIDRLAL
jgi:hypothetical protein